MLLLLLLLLGGIADGPEECVELSNFTSSDLRIEWHKRIVSVVYAKERKEERKKERKRQRQRDREREREREREKERERESVCVCIYIREREKHQPNAQLLEASSCATSRAGSDDAPEP